MAGKTVKDTKRKVLYLITKGNWGGAQRYVFDLATNLSPDQFEVVVAFGEGDVLEKRLSESKVRTIRIVSLKRDINIFSEFKVFFEILKVLRAERPQVLHLNSSKAGALGALAGRLTGIQKIVFTGHGWAWNEDRSPASKAVITLIHWITILLSHQTIAVAETIKNQVDKLPFVSKKVTTIHNGIGQVKFLDRTDARRELHFAAKEKSWIGAISELHKNKGLDYLIQAFGNFARINHDIALIIIGDGEEKEGLIKLAEENGVKDRVFFLGFIPNASIYLKAFDIFALPSRTEAFPYAILEAGLAQVPIVASAVGGIPEAIKNGDTGFLIESGNMKELAQSLNFLIENTARAAEVSQSMRKRVEQLFSLQSMVEKTVAVYNE